MTMTAAAVRDADALAELEARERDLLDAIAAAEAKIADLGAQIAAADTDPASVKDWARVGGWKARRDALRAQLDRERVEVSGLQPELRKARGRVQERANQLAEARRLLAAAPGWFADRRSFDALDAPVVTLDNLRYNTASVLRWLLGDLKRARAVLLEAGEDAPAEIVIRIPLTSEE